MGKNGGQQKISSRKTTTFNTGSFVYLLKMACVVCKIWFESWLRPKPLTPEVSIKRLEKVGRTFFSDTHFFFLRIFSEVCVWRIYPRNIRWIILAKFDSFRKYLILSGLFLWQMPYSNPGLLPHPSCAVRTSNELSNLLEPYNILYWTFSFMYCTVFEGYANVAGIDKSVMHIAVDIMIYSQSCT